jgi:hypothetical protein
MACLLGPIIPSLVVEGVSLSMTVVYGGVMVSYHPWVHHLARGLILWGPDLFLAEVLVGVEGALQELVGSQVNQTTMNLCLPERQVHLLPTFLPDLTISF